MCSDEWFVCVYFPETKHSKCVSLVKKNETAIFYNSGTCTLSFWYFEQAWTFVLFVRPAEAVLRKLQAVVCFPYIAMLLEDRGNFDLTNNPLLSCERNFCPFTFFFFRNAFMVVKQTLSMWLDLYEIPTMVSWLYTFTFFLATEIYFTRHLWRIAGIRNLCPCLVDVFNKWYISLNKFV